jgi:hypothetical protein
MKQNTYFAHQIDIRNIDRNGRWLYEQIKRVHVNRAIGRYRHYCVTDGDIDAGTKPGKETGKISGVPDEPAPMEYDLVDVLPR